MTAIKKIIKKLLNKHLLQGALALACLHLQVAQAEELSFEDLFKDVDFEQLAKEIEEELKKIEQEPQRPDTRDSSPFPTSSSTPAPYLPAKPEIKAPEPALSGDSKTLFLSAYKADEKKNAERLIPIKKKEAYDHFMDRLVTVIRAIETRVIVDNSLSSTFREHFSGLYKQAIDTLESEYNQIESTDQYLLVFFSDKSDKQQLRERIVALVERLELLQKDLLSRSRGEYAEVPVALLKTIPRKAIEPKVTVERRTNRRHAKNALSKKNSTRALQKKSFTAQDPIEEPLYDQ